MDDRNAPATKGDLSDLEQRLLEAIRDSQTEVLKAFYSYAKSTDLKLKDSEVADFAVRQRLTVIESRLMEVEQRLNIPPSPH